MTIQLKTITTQIGDAIDMTVNPTDTGEVIAKINRLSMLLPASCQAVALSEMIYSQKMQQLTEDHTWAALSPTDRKMIFAGRARAEAYYVTLTERQNKALTHALESLRAMLGE